MADKAHDETPAPGAAPSGWINNPDAEKGALGGFGGSPKSMLSTNVLRSGDKETRKRHDSSWRSHAIEEEDPPPEEAE
jgi:hypothetical protein